MKIKRAAAYIITAAIAFGAAAFPAGNPDSAGLALKVSASQERTDPKGFVIEDDYYRGRTLVGYKGKGGKVTLPEEIDSIGAKAFMNNNTITEIIIPEGAERISTSAFEGCKKLKKVTFKGALRTVGNRAFAECKKLKTVTFEKNAGQINAGAFCDCYALEKVSLLGGASLENADGSPCGGIGDDVFSQCYKLRSVEFAPDAAVDNIYLNAFHNCFSLRHINLPSGLAEISMRAFLNCADLESVAVPAGTVLKKQSLGYSYDVNGNGEYAKYFAADGKTQGAAFTYGNEKELYSGMKKTAFTPKALTLIVEKGSPAEKYAQENGIKYEYCKNGLAAPVGLTASGKNGKITLKWFGVSGAKSYNVYMYNAKTDKFELYKNVTGKTCTVTGLAAGKEYKFKVAAANKTAEGSLSGAVTKKI